MSALRVTHIGGPTVLLEVAGWRGLTDPTFRRPRPAIRLRLGDRVAQARGAGAERGGARVDAVLLSHDHHADNLDDTGRALLPSAGAVVTTESAARRLGGHARGLAPLR